MKTNSFLRWSIASVVCALSLVLSFSTSQAKDFPEEAKAIPIQHNGQVKSFESFASETLNFICEKSKWQGKFASQAILEAAAHPETVKKIAWIKINNKDLRHALGLSEERSFFSYEEVEPSIDRIIQLAQSAQGKRDADLRPVLVEQKAESLYGQIVEVKKLGAWSTLRVVPPDEGDTWQVISETEKGEPFGEILRLAREGNTQELKAKILEWNKNVHQKTSGRFVQKIRMEVLYQNVKPFQWAWIFYLGAFVFLSLLKKKRWITSAGLVFVVLALFFHTLGLVLRVLILERPPVSNMYESVVYMNWTLMVFASLFSLFRRQTFLVSVGSLISAVIMIYGNLLPIDSSLVMLPPVLRSNYWLMIHVLTIVSSYGVFGLAMGLGHRYLILSLRKKLTKKEEENSADNIYRTIQIGTFLLGVGTFLGGVWANESWGRFWGWDAKETWALITFLGYLVIIHLYHFKLIDYFWLAMSAVLGFLFVLMTWYGVNFVLGRGLHSYGQGSGGIMWIVYYLLAEAGFLTWVFLRRQK